MENYDLTTLIFNEDFEKAKDYVIKNSIDLNYINNKGGTPLLVAIDTGDLDMIKFLLDHGANPNFLSKEINTPLIEAIEIAVEESDYTYHGEKEPRIDVIELLIKYGADIRLKDGFGRTPISFASRYHLRAQKLFEEMEK